MVEHERYGPGIVQVDPERQLFRAGQLVHGHCGEAREVAVQDGAICRTDPGVGHPVDARGVGLDIAPEEAVPGAVVHGQLARPVVLCPDRIDELGRRNGQPLESNKPTEQQDRYDQEQTANDPIASSCHLLPRSWLPPLSRWGRRHLVRGPLARS